MASEYSLAESMKFPFLNASFPRAFNSSTLMVIYWRLYKSYFFLKYFLMSQDLKDELDALEAIYPGCYDYISPLVYRFRIPQYEYISIKIRFTNEYPEQIPKILDVRCDRRGFDEKHVAELLQEVLDSIFTPGIVCIFDFFTECDAILYNGDDSEEPAEAVVEISRFQSEEPEEAETVDQPDTEELADQLDESLYVDYKYDEARERANAKSKKVQPARQLDPLANWSISEAISDRKSTFVGFARSVDSVEDAFEYLDLLKQDRKVMKASHNMTAWRIKNPHTGAQYQDCDDDGETAAGGRLLHLLSIMDVWNVMVVVSRWFGGTHIGPDRFKHINACARDAIVKGGFEIAEGKKKKKK
ncbi:hypothetical protein OGAPHI_003647 [Ogataea philodendri]|uniref:RWD domain-containing protein n=1 Tax=Ogataea philodendri TaxID=1378263 RepID=A0A9P8T411_9ASCO|nr:uncharacterized protein OGAPHI_003647 [Ogataea philodendri]KAH3665463.1 hypothetical protein OGAPHI_003647 [Ogataea philodendri]